MLKLSQMARLSPADVVKRSIKAHVVKAKAGIDEDEEGVYKRVDLGVKATDGMRHCTYKIYGEIDGRGKVSPENPAWVHCSCPYFTYYLEVAVSTRGSSNVVNSNGAFPRVRNPKMVPYLCKHLLAGLPRALRMKASKVKENSVTNREIEQMLKMYKDYIPE